MSNQLENIVNKLKEDAPKIVKDNKGALVGAIVGYLLTDSKQAQSAILGMIAGAVVVDKKDGNE